MDCIISEDFVDPYAKEQLLSFYNFHLRKFGDRPEALRWTPQGQLRRYQMLMDIAPVSELNNSTVLDYGCGTGDFYRFLKRRGIKVKYTGIDINENFIGLAKQKYPECTFSVMNADADDDELEGYFDYIFICGVFNLEVPGVDDDMKNALVTSLPALQQRPCPQRPVISCPLAGPRTSPDISGRHAQVRDRKPVAFRCAPPRSDSERLYAVHLYLAQRDRLVAVIARYYPVLPLLPSLTGLGSSNLFPLHLPSPASFAFERRHDDRAARLNA